MEKKYSFHFHIAYTELRPDITIYFSSSAKNVILIELSCPCEENMEKCHDHRSINTYHQSQQEFLVVGKLIYMPLKKELGVFFRSLLCCLQNQCFNSTQAKKPFKIVSKLSMEFSFCILLTSGNVVWQSVELNSPFNNTAPLE